MTNTTNNTAESNAATKTMESPRSLAARCKHWLVMRQHNKIEGLYLVTHNLKSYAEAMFEAARKSHPARRSHVALYTRDYAERNGVEGLRRDGLVLDESIEIIADAPVDVRVDRSHEHHPMLLLAAYARAAVADIGGSPERRLRVTDDEAQWYVTDRDGNEHTLSTLGGWYNAGAEIRAHRDAIASADDRAHRARIVALGPDASAQAVASSQRADLALYAARREAAEFALGGLAQAGLL